MISDAEARRHARKIRRGNDTIIERGEYDRWARATKGRRQRTPLSVLMAERDVRTKARAAAEDLLQHDQERAEARADGPADAPRDEPPIAPPLPLDGEIVEPIAPPIDLGPPPEPTYDLGGGAAKAARAALEALDARNPEIGGISLAATFGASFWSAWEAAATRVIAKHVGSVQLADDEMVIAGAVAVVVQPIAIPIVKEHGAEWIEKIKRAVGFGVKP